MLIEVRDLAMEELQVFVELNEVQLARFYEPKTGLFIAESDKVAKRALEAGFRPHSYLIEDKKLERARPLFEPFPDVPVYVAKHDDITTITGYNLTGGILVAMYRQEKPTVSALLEELARDAHGECGVRKEPGEYKEPGERREAGGYKEPGERREADGYKESCDASAGRLRVAVMEGIVNPANVGAIIRSAAALNADAVLVTKDCADPLYRRAIRVGMGCVFQIPWTYIPPLADGGISLLKDLGFSVAAMALLEDTLPIDAPELKRCDKLALVFGAEGEGLSDETIKACDYTVKIPMSHGVDSLNVAASSAVAFWEVRDRK